MKSKKISALALLRDNPLLLSLDNPTKSDIREFVKLTISLIDNDNRETTNRFNSKTTVVDVTSTTVVVEQKVITDK
jgi:hypothetical protein